MLEKVWVFSLCNTEESTTVSLSSSRYFYELYVVMLRCSFRLISALLLALFSGVASAQTQFPILRFSICDTVMQGSKCSGYIDFRNNSKSTVSIFHVAASSFNFQPLGLPAKPVRSGDSLRVSFTFGTERGTGEQWKTVQIQLSNDSIIRQRVKFYIKPDPLRAKMEDSLRLSVIIPCPCETAVAPSHTLTATAFADSLVRLTSREVKPTQSGKIVLSFTVLRNGTVAKATVLNSVDSTFEVALLRNLPKMGRWNPACGRPDPYQPKPGEPCGGREYLEMKVSLPVMF